MQLLKLYYYLINCTAFWSSVFVFKCAKSVTDVCVSEKKECHTALEQHESKLKKVIPLRIRNSQILMSK